MTGYIPGQGIDVVQHGLRCLVMIQVTEEELARNPRARRAVRELVEDATAARRQRDLKKLLPMQPTQPTPVALKPTNSGSPLTVDNSQPD
jgi:hypothetical protein